MANKNKNTKKLVGQTDNDPTLDLDRPGIFRHPNYDFDPEIEVDAKTFDVDERRYAEAGRSRAELEIALNEQTKLVEELSFDVEQLRSRQRGLEHEVKAREEISENINHEITELRAQLGDALHTLQVRNTEFSSAQMAFDRSSQLTERLTEKARGLKTASIGFKKKIKALETSLATSEKRAVTLEKELRNSLKSTGKPASGNDVTDRNAIDLRKQLATTKLVLHDLQNYVDGRKRQWSSLETELAATCEQLGVVQEEAEQLKNEISERNSQLIRSREQCISLSDHLAQQKAKVRKLSKKNRVLERSLNHDAKREIASNNTRIAEQSGLLVAQSHELEGLIKDNDRIEKYSDSLRIQLQDQVSLSKVSGGMRHKLEVRLNTANEMIGRLTNQLETEQAINIAQAEKVETMGQEFDREVRLIRFELGAAEETLAGQQLLNEQLSSDLIDSQGFRQELESQLGEAQDESEQSVQDLTMQIALARQEAEDFERKLSMKNSAVADLMRELSKYTSNIELQGEEENVLQKIDGFRTDKNNTSNPKERDGVARFLIGSADGRELRFPLFKNRLTIGRTSHNDIQLDVQYVSRRHAVISTDQGETRVIDWGSKNGVFVNEVQITEQILKPGDIVSIGTADFRYEERSKR